MILLQQMLLFATMMGIGYGTARKGILDRQVTKSISWLVVNVSNPALILSGKVIFSVLLRWPAASRARSSDP